MAGAGGLRNLELEPLEVPKNLYERGNKFIKWPKSDGDDTIVATPVTLRIDPKGYIIYWQEPNKDTESLEISCIRDTRIEKYAKIPKDPQIREVAGNTAIPLEIKCLTIVYGTKFHEPNYLNFIAVEENPLDIVKQWADFLLQLVCHPLTWHISVERSTEKMYAKLRYETNQFGKIPAKKCIKMFGGNPKRAESALHSVGLMTRGRRDEMIEPSDFPLIAFKKVLQLTCQRPELDKVFTSLGARRMSLSLEQMKRFVNTDQRDPRLNEILHPFLTDEQIRDLIRKYEPNIMLSNRSQLSLEGLDAYLQSDANLPVSSAQYGLHQDMSQPLSHYLINSSHNTYLTGNQYRSRSTAEIYRQCLLSGCRCIELDCWESQNGDEPMITHGFTLCSEVSFKEVIEAINESAFKTSQYPVILSFENHVDNPQQQAKMAEFCRDIFGDKLLIDPLDGFPLDPDVPLPSPRDLLGKIIVKNKKQRLAQDTVKKSSSEEKGRTKRGSVASDSVFSPSSGSGYSPSASPQSFSPGRPGVPNYTSKRKQSAPAGPISNSLTPLKMSPSLPTSNMENVPALGYVSDRHASVGGTPKTSKWRRGKLKSAKSFDDDPLPEMPQLERSEPERTSSTLPRVPTQGNRRNQPAPLTKQVKSLELDENAADRNGESKENDGEDVAEESVSEDSETKKKVDQEDEDEDDDDGGRLMKDEFDENMKESGTATKESRAYEAMSSLVNYMQPIRFKDFDLSERRNRSYEISSFTENAALRLITYFPTEFVNYNKRQLSRIYPKGARVDSSNYNPQVFWNAGCQMVALNFQTLGPNMQLNLGLFEFNNNCGFLLKPEPMRRKDRQFDPFAHNTMDGVVAGSVSIKIISGQFLSSSKVSTYVEVDMHGLIADAVRKKFKTPTVNNNGTNPHYDSDTFVINKIVLPAIAILRIGVMDTNGNSLGQRFLPVEGLRPGYRYITLRNESNQPLTMPSLFVHIEVKDYIPEKMEKFARILANPIEYVRNKEKEEKEIKDRSRALRKLLDDEEKTKFGMDDIEEYIHNGVTAPRKPVIIIKGYPPPDTDLNGNAPKENRVILMPDQDDEVDAPCTTPTAKKTRKPGIEEQLEVFEPASLEVMKTSKEFADLERKMEKKVAKIVKDMTEEYDLVYSVYLDKPRKSTFALGPLMSSSRRKLDKVRSMDLPFEMNAALPPEAKTDHMMLLLRQHIGEEKERKTKMNDDFLRSFEDLIRAKQETELKKLEKLSDSEKAAVSARKRLEKDEKIRNLKDLSKEELEQKKKEIVESHIYESVQELRMLASLQEKRCEKVKKEQQEILMTVTDEERSRVDKITREYEDRLLNIKGIFEFRQMEHYHSRRRTNSHSLQDGVNDGDYVTKF